MHKSYIENRKVVIVGAGSVGATFAYALAQNGVGDEIVMVDSNQELMEGQVYDLAHGLPFFPPIKINTGSKEDYRDASVIVITAGAKQKPGETRINLLKRNALIMENIVDDINEMQSQAVVVVVSNPVDILTKIAIGRSSLPPGKVIGSGTVLDSARFRYFISRNCKVDVRNVHAYILGEHGDTEFAAWSMTHIGGVPIRNFCKTCEHCDNWEGVKKRIEQNVRGSAYHIIDYKGSTYFAVGMALVRITENILKNQRSVMTVSTMLNG